MPYRKSKLLPAAAGRRSPHSGGEAAAGAARLQRPDCGGPRRHYDGPLDLAPEDVKDCAVLGTEPFFPVDRITPKDARLLKRMFEDGLIPQKSKSSPRDVSALDAYIAEESELLARTKAEDSRKARIAHLAEHPEEARPEEVTRTLIDAAFIKQRGLGRGGTISIAGFECHKSVTPVHSNKGNRKYTDITIWWIDGDGTRHGDKASSPVLSRRNDPARNWGLGRE